MAVSSSAGVVGAPCPSFSLPSVDGKHYGLEDFAASTAVLIAFICNHCPYVQAIEERLLKLAHSHPPNRLQTVAICSNDAARYPEDGADKLLKRWQNQKYGFPYLIDESQNVAQAFDAVCTPDFFLFGPKRQLFYRGRLDDNWQNPEKVTKPELAKAIELLLANQKPPEVQHPSLGCSIKWAHRP